MDILRKGDPIAIFPMLDQHSTVVAFFIPTGGIAWEVGGLKATEEKQSKRESWGLPPPPHTSIAGWRGGGVTILP